MGRDLSLSLRFFRHLLVSGLALSLAGTGAPTHAAGAKPLTADDKKSICPITGGGRTLTPGEKGVLRLIFKTAIDVDRLRLHDLDDASYKAAAFVRPGDTCNITFVSPRLRGIADFTQAEHTKAFRFFIHEATHIWQESLPEDQRAQRCHLYGYSATNVQRFNDLCNEQQAEAIADYATYAFLPLPKGRSPMRRDYSGAEINAIFNLVETTFPWAAAARAHIDTLRAKEALCRAANPSSRAFRTTCENIFLKESRAFYRLNGQNAT